MSNMLARLLTGCLSVALTLVVGLPPSAAAIAAATGTSTPTASPQPPRPAGPAVGGRLLTSPGVVVARRPGVPALPRADAKAFVVADLESGEVLAAKAAHRRLRPASTLKVLTSLAVLPYVEPSDVYVATQEDAAVVGSKVGLYPGGRYTVEQLFRTMIIASGNDSARALAMAAGGVRPTIRRMNKTAESLQALDTTAVNPTGLDARGQFSSAYDLALFGRAAMANARMRAYATMVSTTLPNRQQERALERKRKNGAPGPKRRPTYEVWTINRLLLNYRGAIGLKTGWTTLAGGTYIGVARRRGHTLLVTVMGSRGDSWQTAATLLNWGFSAVGTAEPVGELVNPVTPTPTPTPTATPERTAVGAGDARPSATAGEQPTRRLTWPVLALVGLAVPVAVMRANARRRRRRRA